MPSTVVEANLVRMTEPMYECSACYTRIRNGDTYIQLSGRFGQNYNSSSSLVRLSFCLPCMRQGDMGGYNNVRWLGTPQHSVRMNVRFQSPEIVPEPADPTTRPSRSSASNTTSHNCLDCGRFMERVTRVNLPAGIIADRVDFCRDCLKGVVTLSDRWCTSCRSEEFIYAVDYGWGTLSLTDVQFICKDCGARPCNEHDCHSCWDF